MEDKDNNFSDKDVKNKKERKIGYFSTTRTVVLGFLLIIIIGTILLMLPVSSASGKVTPCIDALFTTVTSVCVTGLVTVTTATHWSTFGHVIILILIIVHILPPELSFLLYGLKKNYAIFRF